MFCVVELYCGEVVSKIEWGGELARGRPIEPPWANVIIHHSAGSPCFSRKECSTLLRIIQKFYVDEGHLDIGFNFFIGGNDEVYEGQGWGRRGYHAKEWDKRSLGICFIGSYETELPSSGMLKAARDLIQCGVENSVVQPNYSLFGHSDLPGGNGTDCPGQALYEHISSWPRKTF